MAVYKVPQDVEADDKLIGPFSFRQFIYLIVVAISMAGAWGLMQLFPPLVIIPLPIIIFFGALALPLRKDQPMEAYLSAVVSFYFLKSRKRFWIPDGIDSFVTIIPPKDADKIYTKDLNEDEATKRLTYLADLVDTHGWAIRGAGGTPDTSISTDLYYESQQTPDMMDSTSASAQQLTKQLDKEAATVKQEAKANMKAAARQLPTPVAAKAAPGAPVKSDDSSAKSDDGSDDNTKPPTSKLPTLDELYAKQAASVKKEAEAQSRDAVAYATALAEEASENRGVPVAKTPPSTSASTPDTGTMELTREQASELATHSNEKISTLAQEAKHVADKNKALQNGEEVTISLR